MHEEKLCPRCQARMVCMPGNITQCPCYEAAIDPAQSAYLSQLYGDCLCPSCLQACREEWLSTADKIEPRGT